MSGELTRQSARNIAGGPSGDQSPERGADAELMASRPPGPLSRGGADEHQCARPDECPKCVAANPRPGDLLTPTERATATRYKRIYPWLEARDAG